jgi:hypothetical protein
MTMQYLFYGTVYGAEPPTKRQIADSPRRANKNEINSLHPPSPSLSSSIMPPKTARGSNTRAAEYRPLENLFVCKSFVSVSEDEVTTGTSQKSTNFQNAVLAKYNFLLEHQEIRERREQKNLAREKATLTVQSDHAVEKEEKRIQAICVEYPNRTATSIMTKRAHLWRLTKKWVCHEKMYPIGTGENTDKKWFTRILPLFELKYNEKFDKYIPIRNYLCCQTPTIAVTKYINRSIE